MRGAALAELQHSLSLNVLNDSSTPWEEQWTFRSSLGDKRKIDFLLASTSIIYGGVKATSEIDLGSDHRAVKGELYFGPPLLRNHRKNPKCRWRLPDTNQADALRTYHDHLDVALKQMGSLTCSNATKIVLDATFTEGVCAAEECQAKPWESDYIKTLQQDWKNAPSQVERTRFSKLIRKELRRILRKWQSEQAEQILIEFTSLQRTDQLQRAPVLRKQCTAVVEPECFAQLLREVYESDATSNIVDRSAIQQIPLFELVEFTSAIKHMKKRRGSDMNGISLEMIKNGSPLLHNSLLLMFNDMLLHGRLDSTWHNTIFQMLPKSGDPKCIQLETDCHITGLV